MAMLTKGLWVIVADSEKAMILSNQGDTKRPDLREIDRLTAPAVVMNSDRPGRVHESMGSRQSSLEVPDFERLNAEKMVVDLLALLGQKAASGAFSQMVIAAPPQVLGAIRDRMPDALRGRVLAELDKTLTKHSMAGIAEIVAAALEG